MRPSRGSLSSQCIIARLSKCNVVPQEMGKRKLSAQPPTDIRVEIPGRREAVAPCAPKTSPMLSPGKASPKEPAAAAP